jgi:hypothetical protein
METMTEEQAFAQAAAEYPGVTWTRSQPGTTLGQPPGLNTFPCWLMTGTVPDIHEPVIIILK